MGKSIPLAGAALVALGEGTKFLLGQLQATTKAFNQVGAAGLAGADGMSGLRDQFTAAGIDLQLYTKVITANSEALARFGGTAGDGAARFSKALGQVNRDFGTQLMNLGNSFEDIADQTASFIALQGRLGRSQNMTQAQLAKGAFEYAKELDELAKLKGQQKNQILKQQDAAMSESRFRAKYEDLVAKGRVKEAKAMLDFQTRVSATNATLGQGLRDIAGGFVNTEAAQAAFIQTGGRAATIMQSLAAGTMSQEQAFAELQAANKATLPMQRSLAMAVGDMPGVFTPFAQSADFANQKLAEFGRAAGVQATQMAGADSLTGAAVSAQKEMVNLSVQVNLLATNALPHAAKAVTAFAEVLNTGLGAINKKLGTTLAVPQGGAAATTGASTEPAAAGFFERAMRGDFTVDNPRLRRERGFAEGGIARGPETGYTTTLHGAEAVVPLPDGNTIPVEIKGLTSDILMETLAKTLAKANLLQREMTGGGLGAATNISDSFRRGVDDMFTVAAMHAAEAVARGIDYAKQLSITPEFTQSQLMRKMAKGGVTDGPSIAGESGPEAVVPLPDGKSIPVSMDKETFFAGMGTHGSIQKDNIYTDRKLTDMIMSRLGLGDLESKIAINKSGIGTNVSMYGGAGGLGQGVEFGSAIAGGAMRDDIAEAVAQLVEGGQPLQEALKKTAEDFNAAMQEFIKQQAGPNNDNLTNLMMQLVDLQRNQNATSKQILQVSAN
jgi:hypothetical protein